MDRLALRPIIGRICQQRILLNASSTEHRSDPTDLSVHCCQCAICDHRNVSCHLRETFQPECGVKRRSSHDRTVVRLVLIVLAAVLPTCHHEQSVKTGLGIASSARLLALTKAACQNRPKSHFDRTTVSCCDFRVIFMVVFHHELTESVR